MDIKPVINFPSYDIKAPSESERDRNNQQPKDRNQGRQKTGSIVRTELPDSFRDTDLNPLSDRSFIDTTRLLSLLSTIPKVTFQQICSLFSKKGKADLPYLTKKIDRLL